MHDVGRHVAIYGEEPIPIEMDERLADAWEGFYQQDLLAGRETWSGSSLKGKARGWAAQYSRSRAALLRRLDGIAREFGWRVTSKLVLVRSRYHRVIVATRVSS